MTKLTVTGFVIALSLVVLWFGARSWRGSGSSDNSAAALSQATAATKGQQGDNSANAQSIGAQSKQSEKPGGNKKPAGVRRGRGPVNVVLARVGSGVTNDRLNAIGNGDALASVSVVPLANGVLTEVAVVSGQKVDAGDVLARMDSEAERIALDRGVRAIADTRTSLTRFELLRKSRSVTQVQLDQARADFENAKLAERESKLNLDRRSIVAPIAGIVGIVAVQKGDFVTTQSEIATIDNRSSLIIDFWVPERFTSLVEVGQKVDATAYALPGEAFSGEVNAVGSRVEQVSRTMQVRAIIDNTADKLRPGMSFSVKMRFNGNTFPAVDPLAVQWDSNGSYVWMVVDGKVRRTPIRIIQRNPESVLAEGELAIDDQVVVQGILSLRNGAEVRESGSE